MKRKDINVYKLTHTYFNDEEVFIKSNIEEKELCKLIKSIQMKTYDIEETYDLSPIEMRDILFLYGNVRTFPYEKDIEELTKKNKDYFDYIELDLYNIWEAVDIVITEKEAYSDYYKNNNAIEMIRDFIEEELYN